MMHFVAFYAGYFNVLYYFVVAIKSVELENIQILVHLFGAQLLG